MLTRRSRAREVALQLLSGRDHNSRADRAQIERFVHARLRGDDQRERCLRLYDGVVAHLADIDQQLAAAAENWRVARMATVDRNVLRIGAFEMVHCPET